MNRQIQRIGTLGIIILCCVFVRSSLAGGMLGPQSSKSSAGASSSAGAGGSSATYPSSTSSPEPTENTSSSVSSESAAVPSSSANASGTTGANAVTDMSAQTEGGATAAETKPASAASEINTDTISLDFKDADVGSVLRVLSMKSNINIVTGPEVKGLITVRLDNVPWDKALDVILRTYGYVYERDGNVIRVTTREKMKLEPVETRTFIMNYSKASEIQTAIQDILTERGHIKVSERSNMVVVTDIPTNLYRIAEVIKKIDQRTTQAFIDSKVIATKAGVAENMGIDWNPSASLTGSSRPTTFPFPSSDQGVPASLQQFFPVIAGAQLNPITGATSNGITNNLVNTRAFPFPGAAIGTGGTFNYGTLDFTAFKATLNFLQTNSNTKIVSNPRIVVLNNQTAHIQVGQQIPLPTYERNETTGSMLVSGFTYRDTGVVMDVTPHINTAEEILVDLKPEISSVGADQNFGNNVVAPQFNTTQAKTQLLIQSGQTIAIGGLLTDNVTGTEDKVPFLGDLPLIGKLFRNKQQTAGSGNEKDETLFFVTVTTVDSQGQPVVKKNTGKNESQKSKVGGDKAVTDASSASKNSEKKEVTETTDKKAAL